MPGEVGIMEMPRLNITSGNSKIALEKDPAM
jgi:hypothetical protein